jgi:arginine/serine-rich splicing factor 17
VNIFLILWQVLAKLDMKTIKLSGFQELLKVRAAESKPQFPTR